MAIKLIKINGEHPKINYEKLQESFINLYSRTCYEATIYVLNRFPVLVTSDSDIDFLLIIALKDSQGNYISFKKNDMFNFK